jgi:5-methyltetrahydrofolate--homocysteine methyltransferase
MRTTLETLLGARDWLMADGATGTNLFNMGLEAGDAPDLWNETEPDKVRALYDGSVGAGSDLFLTNSFGGNASRLKLHDAEDRAYAINRRAAEIGRDAADAVDRPVVVAGSMGPTGEIMAPLGTLTIEEAADMFEEQARVGPKLDFFRKAGFVEKDLRHANSSRVADAYDSGLRGHVTTV